MKFLCVACDRRMDFAQREIPGDGTLAAVFDCPDCGRAVAMLTNPMETQLVSSLGVKIGGSEVPEEPMEGTREMLADRREGSLEEASAPEGAGAGTAESSRAGPAEAADATSSGGADGPGDAPPVEWTEDAVDRLGRVPSFVRGMVRRIYTDWARERDIRTITPEVMDRARTDLGLEGM